jgi:hypothetical protein
MMAIAQRLRLFAKETLSWLFVAYLIFAGYVIFDTLTFAFDPMSGRISSFSCQPNPPNETICTVTIYGFLGTYQRSFPADTFGGAGLSSLLGYSDCVPYGIGISAGSQEICFVYPQGIDGDRGANPKLTQTIDEINGLFIGNTPLTSKTIFYNSVNPGVYPYLLRRIILLVAGLLIVLIYGRLKHSINKHKTSITEPVERTFARDVFSWWRINLLARFFFYLSILPTISIFFLFPKQLCQVSVELSSFSCPGLQAFPASPFGYLFCLYHFIAFTTLQGYLQWRHLKQRISLSAWWIATPIFAGLPLLFIKSPVLTCGDCLAFRVLPSGAYSLGQNISPPIGKGVIVLFLVYFFLLGCAQWLVLKHKSNSANSWIFTPLINSTTLMGSGFLIQFLSYVSLPFFGHDSFFAVIFLGLLSFLLAFGMQDIISGLVISKILRANAVDKPELMPTSTP